MLKAMQYITVLVQLLILIIDSRLIVVCYAVKPHNLLLNSTAKEKITPKHGLIGRAYNELYSITV
jgi:hypothetical protein